MRRGTGATALAAIRAKIADGPIFLPRPGSPSRWPCATATRRQDRRRRPRLRRRGRSRPEHAVLQASGCIPATGFHRLRPRRPPHDAAGLVLRQVVHAVRTEPSQRDVAGLLAVISAGFSTRGSVATQRRRWRSTRLLQHASATSTANATACCIAAAAPGHPKGPVSCITPGHGPVLMAKDGGFEPPRACTQHAFQLRVPVFKRVARRLSVQATAGGSTTNDRDRRRRTRGNCNRNCNRGRGRCDAPAQAW